MKILVVIDMQNDFITGALRNSDAISLVSPMCEYIKNFDGAIVYTKDIHFDNYLDTLEGKNLPIPHCIKGTSGADIERNILLASNDKKRLILEKNTFGLSNFGEILSENFDNIEKIELVGVCTGICVISNAMILKSYFQNIPIVVIESLCACVSHESHECAINAMKMCQIEVVQ